MPTLLLRIAGPMQSWGSGSKLEIRTTAREPTKSGILGMIAAAMGRSREESMDDLSALKFGVRIDQEGTLLRDFHTVHDSKGEAYLTYRHYLQDAVFLVGLEGSMEFLVSIQDSLKHPYYPLFLGRRSCPPDGKMCIGIRDCGVSDALLNEPWQASLWYRKKQSADVSVEVVIDCSLDEPGSLAKDVPVSYSQERRIFRNRKVSRDLNAVHMENPDSRSILTAKTEHDAFDAIREE